MIKRGYLMTDLSTDKMFDKYNQKSIIKKKQGECNEKNRGK